MSAGWIAWIDPAPYKVDGATVNLEHVHRTNRLRTMISRRIKPAPFGVRDEITDYEVEILLRIAATADVDLGVR